MSPIQINLFPHSPEISLWFRVDNRSDSTVELDRLLVDVWYPQPVVEGAILDRYLIEANELVDTPHFHASLTPDNVDIIRRTAIDQAQHAELQIYIRAYFNTDLGTVAVQGRITRQRGEFPIQLPPPT